MILDNFARILADGLVKQAFRLEYSTRRREKRIVSDAKPLSKERLEEIARAFREDIERIFKESNGVPMISVVIPLRNAKQDNVRKMMGALTSHDYPNFEIILVGGENDTTWKHLTEEHLAFGDFTDAVWEDVPKDQVKYYSENATKIRIFRGKRITLVEVSLVQSWHPWKQEWVDWIGRDTNVKRNVGARLAKGEIIAFTDNKITYPKGYLSKAAGMLLEHGTGAVAGEVKGRKEDKDDWIDVFGSPGGSRVRRFPTFGSSFYLDQTNLSSILGVTASLVMTKLAYWLMGGLDERATTSYEDYMSEVRYLENGGNIWMCDDDDFKVEHGTRKVWADLKKEWKRSGTGAEDTWEYYPNSAFSKNRWFGVKFVLGLIGAALGGTGLLLFFDLYLVLGLLVLGGLVIGLGVCTHNAYTAKKWYGFFFPFLTAYLIWLFTISFIRQFLFRDGAERLLQMMWQFQFDF